MKRAKAPCVGSEVCQSVTYFALDRPGRELGVTTKPSRSVGSIVLENEPT